MSERIGTDVTSRTEDDELHEVTRLWWVLALGGALSLIVGIIVLVRPDTSLATLAVITGIFLLVDGIVELVAAALGGMEDRTRIAILGAVSAIAGVILIRHPTNSVVAIALLLGLWLIVIGVVHLVWAFGRAGERRGWRLIGGAVELIAGIVIVSSPGIGVKTLALLVGLAFTVRGIAMLALGFIARRAGKDLEAGATRPPVTSG